MKSFVSMFAAFHLFLGISGCATSRVLTPVREIGADRTVSSASVRDAGSRELSVRGAAKTEQGWALVVDVSGGRPLPTTQRTIRVRTLAADGTELSAHESVARLVPTTSRFRARRLAVARVSIPDPTTFDHAEVSLVR
jgi:hypothetical protein